MRIMLEGFRRKDVKNINDCRIRQKVDGSLYYVDGLYYIRTYVRYRIVSTEFLPNGYQHFNQKQMA